MVIKKTTSVTIDFSEKELNQLSKILDKCIEAKSNESLHLSLLKDDEKNMLSKLLIGIKS